MANAVLSSSQSVIPDGAKRQSGTHEHRSCGYPPAFSAYGSLYVGVYLWLAG